MAVQYNPPGVAGPTGVGLVTTTAAPITNNSGQQTGTIHIPRDKRYRPMKLLRLIGPLVQFVAELVIFQPINGTGSTQTDLLLQYQTTYMKRLMMWMTLGFALEDAVDGFDF